MKESQIKENKDMFNKRLSSKRKEETYKKRKDRK